MNLINILKDGKKEIVIIGVLPIADEIEKSYDNFGDLLISEEQLKIYFLCESDSLCFQYSLLTDTVTSKNRKSYANLIMHRNRILGSKKIRGFSNDVIKYTNDISLSSRIIVKQQNAVMPFSAIIIDKIIYCTFTTNKFPSFEDYLLLENDNALYSQIKNYMEFFIHGEGNQYLSKPGEELLELYDKERYPRGIYPRSCFYTTKFKRHSMWGFVFNRKGKLLLHQRSFSTKDGRGLWDKSTGGHVDLREESMITAKRELVEELFLPEAEFSKYIQAYIKDIISFGEWNLDKRPESSYKGAFDTLNDDDWILFSATDGEGNLLTIDRISQRRIHIDDNNIVFKPTNFVSDVFFFISPWGYIDNDEQMYKTFEKSEEKGAAQAHKLISLEEFKDWIEEEVQKGTHMETFTDDIIYVYNEHMGLLEQFSEFIKYIFSE